MTGRLQSEQDVIHVVAERLEDLTPLLSLLSATPLGPHGMAPTDEVSRPVDELRHVAKQHSRSPACSPTSRISREEIRAIGESSRRMPKGRNFH